MLRPWSGSALRDSRERSGEKGIGVGTERLLIED